MRNRRTLSSFQREYDNMTPEDESTERDYDDIDPPDADDPNECYEPLTERQERGI